MKENKVLRKLILRKFKAAEFDKLDALANIYLELQEAEEEWPEFPLDLVHSFAIVNEEAGEAQKAILDYLNGKAQFEDIRAEIVQTAAMCVRFLINHPTEHHLYKNRWPFSLEFKNKVKEDIQAMMDIPFQKDELFGIDINLRFYELEQENKMKTVGEHPG